VRALALAVAVFACGGQTNQIEHAKQARYDAELSVLVAETAEVVRRWYAQVEVDRGGTIHTGWQEIPRRAEYDQWYDTQTTADRDMARIKYFVRFHIAISGTRPSRIEVTGHSARWFEGKPGPTELRAEEERPWTKELADKLRLKIHAKLERFAR
jgi:hypothetical protein